MTEIFRREDISGDCPSCICDKCAQLAMRHEPTESVFAYCRHREVGAMKRPGGEWIISEEISGKDFKAVVMLSVMEGEQLYIDAQTSGMSEN